MPDNVVRISDYERKSREADAAAPREPSEAATIIILPVVKVEPYDGDDDTKPASA